MHITARITLLLVITVLAFGLAACSAGLTPSPTAPLPTAAVEETPAVPTILTAAPGLAPTATPSPAVTPWAGQLPTGTIALIGTAGYKQEFLLHALSADGTLTNLGLMVELGAVASRSSRWIAYPATLSSASPMQIYDLEQGRAYTIPAGWEGADILGSWAFDAEETRLAYLEVAQPLPGERRLRWAIVVVNLADGSTTRFEAPTDPKEQSPFGAPLGWATNGDLILATFRPYSEGGWYGIWALALPPGAASAPLNSLNPRQLLPDGTCQSITRLSPDGTRLLYLGRNKDYKPANYDPPDYDIAVNQLWSLDLASGTPQLLVEVTDGGALAYDAAWSPDGSQVLFAEGRYAGEDFSLLALKVRGPAGEIRDVGPLPFPELWRLAWCTPETALAASSPLKLYRVDLSGGRADAVATEGNILLLGQVAR